jgi:hypothetical protein
MLDLVLLIYFVVDVLQSDEDLVLGKREHDKFGTIPIHTIEALRTNEGSRTFGEINSAVIHLQGEIVLQLFHSGGFRSDIGRED